MKEARALALAGVVAAAGVAALATAISSAGAVRIALCVSGGVLLTVGITWVVHTGRHVTISPHVPLEQQRGDQRRTLETHLDAMKDRTTRPAGSPPPHPSSPYRYLHRARSEEQS